MRPGTHPVGSANRPRRPRRVVGAIARGSGGGDGAAGRRLGGQAERREVFASKVFVLVALGRFAGVVVLAAR